MNLLYPKIRRPQLQLILALAGAGACIGALYGIAHDEITYTLGPEYFTRLKFHQFAWANLGFPPRVYAGEIGALAVGWVGACTGWLLARMAVPAWPKRTAIRYATMGFAIVLVFALAGGITGFWLGEVRRGNPDFSNWDAYLTPLAIQNPASFVLVGYIHNAGYIGGLLGLVVAITWLIRKRVANQREPADIQASGN